MPLKNYSDKYLRFNLDDMVNNFYFEKEEIYTITIWIKYEGQLRSNKDKCVTLLRFTKDGTKYVCYNSEKLMLYFYDNGKVMYEDPNFYKNIGQWSLISAASFLNNVPTIKNLASYFDFRYNFFVNWNQLVQKPGTVVKAPGWKLDTVEIGYGFSAIVTDLKIYRNFITNPWGYVNGPKNGISIEFLIPMNGKRTGTCLTDQEIVVDHYKDIKVDKTPITTTLGVQCVKDFSPYETGSTCSTGKYWDVSKFGESLTPCSDCEDTCFYNCANKEPNGLGCVCDWESADAALRIDKDTQKTKCEQLPYTEFSKLEEFSASGLKSAKDGEYSIEFWYYMYTYTNTTAPFESEEIIWNNHNKITLFAKNDIMNVGCTPVYVNSKPSQYTFQKNESIGEGLFKWVYITCSVNTNKGVFYGIRGNEWDIETPRSAFPDYKSLSTSDLIFRPGKKTPANYGMLFIKDIKLWSIYNIKRFETKCYRPVGVLFHEQLLHYFRNDRYTNSIRDEITLKTAGGTKRKDFFGYNVLNLKSKTDMIQPPFGICSVINVYPTTGVINVTKFTVQSKENEQLPNNTYRFYYYIKGVSQSPINIGVQYGNPDVNVIFEYPDIPKTVEVVVVELYVEVIPERLKSYTLFKQLTLYRESNEGTKLDYNNILQTLTLNSDMNDDMILDAQKSINRLETDLPKGLNNTFVKAKAKGPKSNKTISRPKASCEDSSLCNGRGVCYTVEVMTYCSCNKGFTGRYCQLTEENYKTLVEYQSKLSSIITYNLINNTNFEKPNAVTEKDIEAINLGFNTDLQNFQNYTDMSKYINTMDALVKNSNQGNMQKVLTKNREEVMDIPSKMLGYLQTSVYKTKYDNLKNSIIASGNYTDPEGKYTVKFLNQTITPVNSNITLNNNSTNNSTGGNRRRKLTRKDFKRNLQQTQNLTTPDFVITINDPSILTLTPEQNADYKKSYEQIYSQFEGLTKTFINGSLGNPIKMNKVNTMYNYTLDHFYLSELQSLDFNNYFADRIRNGESYFDAKACLIENSAKLRTEDYNYFYIAFYFDQTPFFNFNRDLLDRSLSLNSFISVFDANSYEIRLDCKVPIKHYIGLYPQNQDFVNKFNLYPEKYQSSDPIYQSKEYMPYFIFPNGTIDHTNPLNVQKDMYYRQYLINVTDYNNPNPKDTENFKNIIGNNYILAEAKKTGNVAAFGYFDGLTGQMGNNYYFKYNQIFQCGPNYSNNMCFIFLICFLAFNIPLLILIICLRNMYRNFNSLNEWCNREEKIMEKDSAIFGCNRYTFWKSGGIISNPINSSKVIDNNMVMESGKNEAENASKKDAENNQLYENENVAVKEPENKMQKVGMDNESEFAGENRGICYSFFYFLIFRNIYSSFVLLTSPFSPKYRTFSKFMFLIYCEMLFTALFFSMADFDLYNKVKKFLIFIKFFLIDFSLFVNKNFIGLN